MGLDTLFRRTFETFRDMFRGGRAEEESSAVLAPAAVEAAPPPQGDGEVLAGSNGFLFHQFDKAFEQFCGDVMLPPAEVEHWRMMLEGRHAWCAERGIRFIFAVVPEKHIVYSDKLPAPWRLKPYRPVHQIFEALSPTVRRDCLYYETALRDVRAEGDSFFRTDVHWTQLGAFTAYHELIRALQSSFPLTPISRAGWKWKPRRFRGGLSLHMEQREWEMPDWIDPDPNFGAEEIFSTKTFKPGQVDIFKAPAADDLKLVLFRDSNATGLLPFLASHFRRTVAVATGELFADLVENERPDVVIIQTAERWLAHLSAEGRVVGLGDQPVVRYFPQLTSMTLPLPEASDTFKINFWQSPDQDAALRELGWSNAEPRHRWMIGPRSMLRFSVPPRGSKLRLAVSLWAMVAPPRLSSQNITLMVNGVEAGSWTVSDPTVLPVEIDLTALPMDRSVTLEFLHPDAARPADLIPGNGDTRDLALALQDITATILA